MFFPVFPTKYLWIGDGLKRTLYKSFPFVVYLFATIQRWSFIMLIESFQRNDVYLNRPLNFLSFPPFLHKIGPSLPSVPFLFNAQIRLFFPILFDSESGKFSQNCSTYWVLLAGQVHLFVQFVFRFSLYHITNFRHFLNQTKKERKEGEEMK